MIRTSLGGAQPSSDSVGRWCCLPWRSYSKSRIWFYWKRPTNCLINWKYLTHLSWVELGNKVTNFVFKHRSRLSNMSAWAVYDIFKTFIWIYEVSVTSIVTIMFNQNLVFSVILASTIAQVIFCRIFCILCNNKNATVSTTKKFPSVNCGNLKTKTKHFFCRRT